MRNANQITVSNLLTHTSGIDIPNTEQPRNKSYSEAAAINWIVKHVTKNTEKKVGKWNYNNVNFVLLACIIRKTTGSSYSATVKQFYALTHLPGKDSTYSGGMYIKNGGQLKLAYGNVHNTYFGNWVQLTSDNQNGTVMFLNLTKDGTQSQQGNRLSHFEAHQVRNIFEQVKKPS